MGNVTVSAFKWVPPFAQGLVRDLRVRWALEECGIPYEARLIGFEDRDTEAYRALQPFGQVPTLQIDGLSMFESGAIVLTLAERHVELCPPDEAARIAVRTWLFAALNTVEPPIAMLNFIQMQPADTAEGMRALREQVTAWICSRLDVLGARVGTDGWLVADRFTAADLMLATVLRILRTTDLVDTRPALAGYLRRCEARPAFGRALAAQMQPFSETPA